MNYHHSKPSQVDSYRVTSHNSDRVIKMADGLLEDNSVKKLIERRNVFIGFLIALCIHFFLFLFTYTRLPLSLFEFWMFLATDILLWTIGLIPLIAGWRGFLKWYDPLFWLALIFFGTFFGTYISFSLEPTYVISVFSSLVIHKSGFLPVSEYLSLWAQAELVLLIFWGIILITNNRELRFITRKNPTYNELRAAFLVGVIGFLFGIYGFVRFWIDKDFIQTFLLFLGQVEVGSGEVRYLTLQNIALYAIPLGLLGLMGLYKITYKKDPWMWALLILMSILIFPNIFTGARIFSVFYTILTLSLFHHFGFSLKRSHFTVIGLILVALIFTITILRGNRFVSETPQYVADDLFKGDLIDSFITISRLGGLTFA